MLLCLVSSSCPCLPLHRLFPLCSRRPSLSPGSSDTPSQFPLHSHPPAPNLLHESGSSSSLSSQILSFPRVSFPDFLSCNSSLPSSLGLGLGFWSRGFVSSSELPGGFRIPKGLLGTIMCGRFCPGRTVAACLYFSPHLFLHVT